MIDAHAHLTDPRFAADSTLLGEIQKHGITRILLGGVEPDEWTRQKSLKAKWPTAELVFGIHPYWVSAHSGEDLRIAMKVLEQEAPAAFGMGEMGLDLRSPYKDSEARQKVAFSEQLELSIQIGKTSILHVVRAHREAWRIVDSFSGRREGFVHAFNADESTARQWISRGYSLSVGGALLNPNNMSLRGAVQAVPLESLLVESDAPDQKPNGWPEELNKPWSVFWIVKEIAVLRNIPEQDVINRVQSNFQRIFYRELNREPSP